MAKTGEIKISISYQDLVQFMGGTDEASLELRQCVVQTFAKNYLKDVANSKFIQEQVALVNRSIIEEVKNKLGEMTGSYYSPKVTLKPEFEKHIRAAVKEHADSIVKGAIGSVQTGIKTYINTRLKDFDAELQKYVDQAVSVEIQQAVDKKVKAKIASVMENLVG